MDNPAEYADILTLAEELCEVHPSLGAWALREYKDGSSRDDIANKLQQALQIARPENEAK